MRLRRAHVMVSKIIVRPWAHNNLTHLAWLACEPSQVKKHLLTSFSFLASMSVQRLILSVGYTAQLW
jgi:hypothetical protein